MRVKITLVCSECKQRNYDSTKNKKNDPDRLELNKYCRFCRKHTLHKETKEAPRLPHDSRDVKKWQKKRQSFRSAIRSRSSSRITRVNSRRSPGRTKRTLPRKPSWSSARSLSSALLSSRLTQASTLCSPGLQTFKPSTTFLKEIEYV